MSLVCFNGYLFLKPFPSDTEVYSEFYPVPPPYSVATSLPTYDEAEKAKAAALAAAAAETSQRVRQCYHYLLRIISKIVLCVLFFFFFLVFSVLLLICVIVFWHSLSEIIPSAFLDPPHFCFFWSFPAPCLRLWSSRCSFYH